MDETDPEIHFKEDQRELDMGQGDVDENYGENANDEHLTGDQTILTIPNFREISDRIKIPL